jgi:two-component system sensor histidine kinase CssS
MRKLPLGLQIWLVFAAIFSLLVILLLLILPTTLKSFFTNQMYLTIQDAQRSVLYEELERRTPLQREQQKQNFRTVQHLILNADGLPPARAGFAPREWRQFQKQASEQTEESAQYQMNIEDSSIYYMITKASDRNRTQYLLSYVWDTYPKELLKELYSKLILFILFILIVSWLPSLWLIKYVSKPITEMVKQVKRIAERDWHEPLKASARKDEIGQLSSSMEWMRQKLVEQDEAQQGFLQHISHELKTPVMVIRSYTNAIQEGIFPKGDMEGSVQVIDQEAERLERRIQNLLYLTKLDYLKTHPEQVMESFDMRMILEQTMERLRWKRPELEWKVELTSFMITGNEEQWLIAMENLLDNQIRYASSVIHIELRIGGVKGYLIVGNDGPSIADEIKARLFQPFSKGRGGKFGLGLMILKRIADMHQVDIEVGNRKPAQLGAVFTLTFSESRADGLAIPHNFS